MHRTVLTRAFLTAGIGLYATVSSAALIAPSDFDTLSLGATITGPVGPTVDASLVTTAGESIGDISSRVQCPDGFTMCTPSTNPAGTVYTYIHEIIPGVDLPNDAPFPIPGTLLSPSGLTQFSLAFPPSGFNGVAGFSFGEANAALVGRANAITINALADGITWELDAADGWDTSDKLTFFWQTVQPPSGPGGQYRLANATLSGIGAGPIPTAPIQVPEPATGALLIGALLALTASRGARRRRRHCQNA